MKRRVRNTVINQHDHLPVHAGSDRFPENAGIFVRDRKCRNPHDRIRFRTVAAALSLAGFLPLISGAPPTEPERVRCAGAAAQVPLRSRPQRLPSGFHGLRLERHTLHRSGLHHLHLTGKTRGSAMKNISVNLFRQVLSLMSEQEFEEIILKHGGSKHLQSFDSRPHFVPLVFLPTFRGSQRSGGFTSFRLILSNTAR
ncbi:uncharacterized protein DUF4372 [Victivallis vadensis]|uniref:Uncharacterized protein DUF4372 n=2 Tax=Victivallis vadensis TaxID=172901 RepID=A0A2U1AP16_9BACT|nr:uncharacterized protein DUF4372 [Victivallis vadensis]